jgi:ferritin
MHNSMLKSKIEDICNRQIEREGYSSNLYLSMASWAETNGFSGVASWLYTQSNEERLHFLKFIKYVNERGGKAVIPAFQKPVFDFKSVEDLFREVLKHEEFITDSINEIVAATLVEEEASVKTILDKVRLVGTNNMYQFDKDILSLRTPAANSQANP